MTADVIERSLSEFTEAAFPAEIPKWVPPHIAEHARRSDFPTGCDMAVVVRLITDPRMEVVWKHLTRRDRKTGRLRQPARFTLNGKADHDFALLMLFLMVLGYVEAPPRALLRRELEDIQRDRAAMAHKLWAEANALVPREESGEGEPGRARILNDAGVVLWQLSREEKVGDIVVERDRGNLETRAVATAIAGAFSRYSAIHSIASLPP